MTGCMHKVLIIVISILVSFPFAANALLNDELKITLQSSVISLDPGGIQDSQSLFVSRQVNCQLVRNQGPSFVMDAAESIKYVTPNKVMLKLSKKAKFHDGSQVKAGDVIASFDYIKSSRNVFNGFFAWVTKIESNDDVTITFLLTRHIPQFIKVLSSTNFTIFKKSFIEQAKVDKSRWKAPLGCGGYKVSQFNNEKIKLVPVADGLPIEFDVIKENQIAASEVMKYDIVTVNVIGESRELNQFNILEMLDPIQYFLGLNAKSKLWKNKNERCNFLTQLDMKELLEKYGSRAMLADDLLPKGVLGYKSNSDYIAKMKSAITDPVRYPDTRTGSKLRLAYLTVSMQDKYKNDYIKMISKLYPDIVLKPIADVKKFGKKFVDENGDVLLFALKSDYLDGYEYLTIFENNDGNFTGLHNDNWDKQVIRSQLITSAAERAKEYRKIVNEIRNACIVRPLVTLPARRTYVRKNLSTPGIGLNSILDYYLGKISK